MWCFGCRELEVLITPLPLPERPGEAWECYLGVHAFSDSELRTHAHIQYTLDRNRRQMPLADHLGTDGQDRQTGQTGKDRPTP